MLKGTRALHSSSQLHADLLSMLDNEMYLVPTDKHMSFHSTLNSEELHHIESKLTRKKIRPHNL